MALTDLLNAEYGEVSRDFTTDIVAHRDFPELLTLVYECRILSNPWLAAVTDEKRHARLRTTESFSSSSSSSAQALSSMPPSMCVADGIGAPSFAHHLRGMFNDTARAVRKNHGVASIVDPGTDPELDKVVGAVRSKYSRWKNDLLVANNREVMFRKDLRKRMARGLWNRYDLDDDIGLEEATHDLLSDKGCAAHQQRSQQGKADGGFVISQRTRPKRPTPAEHCCVDDATKFGMFKSLSSQVEKAISPPPNDGMDADNDYMNNVDGIGSAKSSASSLPSTGSSGNMKRGASSKFEKDQVLPLTQWLLDHSSNPYPSMEDKAVLATESGLSTQQVQNWFINMRKRHWTPMMNGKRKPRTFLDYVILSSKKNKKSRDSDCGTTRKAASATTNEHLMTPIARNGLTGDSGTKRKSLMRQAAQRATTEISRLTDILQYDDDEETNKVYDGNDDTELLYNGGLIF